jgi:hypothetical protein
MVPQAGVDSPPDLGIGPALAGLLSSVGLYGRGKSASAVNVGVEWSGRESLADRGPVGGLCAPPHFRTRKPSYRVHVFRQFRS